MLAGESSDEMDSGVSFLKVDFLARSVSRNIAFLEDKEIGTDLTHNRE